MESLNKKINNKILNDLRLKLFHQACKYNFNKPYSSLMDGSIINSVHKSVHWFI